MATEQLDNASMAVNHQPATDIKQDYVVSIDLPAPHGWTKKFIPSKSGTPRRNEIVFFAPTGEKITTKRQLEQYLKSLAGGPSASEFDWGTGDTLRRSSRISSKPKPTSTPDSGSSRKKQKRPSSKKEAVKKQGTDEGAASGEGEVTADKTEGAKDVEMKDAEGGGNLPQKGKAEEGQIAANPAEASVDAAKDNAGETEPKEDDSIVMVSSDGKETLEKVPEGELQQVAVQVSLETAVNIKEELSEVGLTDSVVAVEVQPAKNEEVPAKEMLGAQVQPEAALVNIVQSVNEVLGAADAEAKDTEKAVSSEEVKENQDTTHSIDDKPANAGNVAPAIIC